MSIHQTSERYGLDSPKQKKSEMMLLEHNLIYLQLLSKISLILAVRAKHRLCNFVQCGISESLVLLQPLNLSKSRKASWSTIESA